MHYYIDGYNLMFRILRVSDEALSLQRAKIIEDLNHKAAALHLNLTVVFDAHYQLGESSRSHFDQLEIIFSGTGQTADEYIIHEIKSKKHPLQHTVVTSDKKLAWLVRRHSVKTETVEEFLCWLNKRYENKKRTPLPPILKPKKPAPSKKKAVPPTQSTVQECFSYYLETFQKFIETPKQDPIYFEKLPKKRKAKEPPERVESDFSRWERIFKENFEQEK